MRMIFNIFVAISLLLPSLFSTAGTLGVYTSPAAGFDTHTFYYDDGEEVTIFDTQFVPTLTAEMVKKIKSETQSKITRVVVTHPNPDKFNGLSYLHGMGVSSISSTQVAAQMPAVHEYKKNFWVNVMGAFKESEYPVFESIQKTFDEEYVITLKSGETITLFQLKNSGVATSQVVARIDTTGDLIVGDLVHTRAHAWLEGGLENGIPKPDLVSWVNALSELPALSKGHGDAIVYGGRGEFVRVKDAVIEQMNYLTQAQKIVDQFLVAENLNEHDFSNNNKALAYYNDLTGLFTESFPDYQAPYMIKYSIYGLVDLRMNEIKTKP